MPRSPIDSMPAPETLEARVVRPAGHGGEEPRLHGYGVQSDLARHYTPGETALLSLLGELPDERQRRRFEVASTFASAVSARDAPVHAAILARRYGSTPAALTSVAAIVLAERARDEVAALSGLFAWTEEQEPPPAAIGPPDPQVGRLRSALSHRDADFPRLGAAPWTLDAALCMTFIAAGLRAPWQLEAALTIARLPVVMAEAMAHGRGDLAGYPIRQPPFSFDDD